ncbi:hypothetical protein KAR28_03650 [Candidatus Parcubacteria bacterium]|nr:hypothetical protein [Candidatus Parcubacteria bacterium]
MPENSTNQNNDYGKILAKWHVTEYEKYERSKKWYITAIAVAFLSMLFAFFTGNFLFAVIIIIVSLIVILHDGRDPYPIDVKIAEDGIFIGKNYYDYDEIKDFAIIYKPRMGIKHLYLNFNSFLKHRLSIYLGKADPLQIREYLLKYLPEDLERTDPPLSETLSRIFKI